MDNRKQEVIETLRSSLQERFGSRQAFVPHIVEKESASSGTDLLCMADLLSGQIHEVSCPYRSAGATCIQQRLIGEVRKTHYLALIDGCEVFHNSGDATETYPLLWLRCSAVKDALKSVDWLLRDRNLSQVFLDLRFFPISERSRIRLNYWHRLRVLCEDAQARLIVFTPEPMISCAHTRWEVGNSLTLREMDRLREDIDVSVVRKKQRKIPDIAETSDSLQPFAEVG